MIDFAAVPRPQTKRSQPLLLCIDDDPDITASIEARMRRFLISVVRAYHGMHGYYEAIRLRPDAILMDLVMPNGDGETILECLRGNRDTADIPVIILTGQREKNLHNRMKRLGANQTLHKPIRFDELKRELDRFVVIQERNRMRPGER